jgi:Arc/MetJ-type ribon-helix-helix transcriptional regulator
MRKIMNISVSEEMYSYILKSVREGCHSSVSEYVRSLVRRDRSERLDRSAGREETVTLRRVNEVLADLRKRDNKR